VEDFLTHVAGKRRGGGTKKLKPLEVATREAEGRAASGDWEGVRGSVLVGLYAMCHRLVYGVPPDELLDKGAFAAASRHAARCLHASFDDDESAIVDFVRWVWEREEGLEKWAAERGISRRRVGVMFQFSASLVTEYRVDARRRRRG
jgi:hypothetical protein